MAKLVLARPGLRQQAEAHWAGTLPLGLGYLAAVARAHGIDVRVVDAKREGHTCPEQTVAAIRQHDPQVVGLTAFTVDYPRAALIAQQLKAGPGRPVTVLGGPQANALPIEALEQAPAVDYVVAGEGESTLLELVTAVRAGRAPDPAPGLHYRDSAGHVCGAGRTAYEDLERLPFPAWDLFPRVDDYPLMTHRGCPFRCVFCSRNLTQRVRSRSAAHVMEEIRWLHRTFAPQRITIEDETFGLQSGPTEALLARLIEFNRHAGLRFQAGTRVDRASVRLFQLMKQAGFDRVELGVESGVPAVLERSGKGVDVGQVRAAVRGARQAGLKIWLNFIIGLPGETKATVRQSIELAVELNPDRLSVAVIVPYPGSEVYRWSQRGENGYRLLSKDWRDYDKYLAAAVELETLDHRTMRRLQGRMYLEVYARNARFGQLARLVWSHRALAWSVGRGMTRWLSDPNRDWKRAAPMGR
jgi:anaerobic magnesium-protoporphyrin IX monomethyl ester cyclase